MNNEFESLINSLKRLTFRGKSSAIVAHSFLFIHQSAEVSEYERFQDEVKAVANLNCANSAMNAAYAIYQLNVGLLKHNDIDIVFEKYFTFAAELMRNFSTGHSHQWSDIEYLDFIEAFENSVLSIPCCE